MFFWFFLSRMSSSFTTRASVSVRRVYLTAAPASLWPSWSSSFSHILPSTIPSLFLVEEKNEKRNCSLSLSLSLSAARSTEILFATRMWRAGSYGRLLLGQRSWRIYSDRGRGEKKKEINSAWKAKEVAPTHTVLRSIFHFFLQDRLYPFMKGGSKRERERETGYATDFAPAIDIDLFEKIGMRLVQSKGISYFFFSSTDKNWSHCFCWCWIFLLCFIFYFFLGCAGWRERNDVLVLLEKESLFLCSFFFHLIYSSTGMSSSSSSFLAFHGCVHKHLCFSHASIYPRFTAHRFRDAKATQIETRQKRCYNRELSRY